MFKFPIKLYHAYYLNKVEEEEKENNLDSPLEASWVQGWARVPVDDITGWYETCSRGRTMDEIESAGCDLTLVVTEKQGEYMCMWPRRKFEQEYDSFMEKWEGWMNKQLAFTIDNATTNVRMEIPQV